MFPNLPAFAEANDTVRAALIEVGEPGGILDAKDDLAAGPKALIVDPSVNGNPTSSDPYGSNPDNPTMTAGSTFVGQFTDHDITFDLTSHLGVTQNPLASPNTRTPALDLDSVFGGGPGMRSDVGNPNGSVGGQLKIGSGGVRFARVQGRDPRTRRTACRVTQRRRNHANPRRDIMSVTEQPVQVDGGKLMQFVFTPVSLSQGVGLALGAQAGEARIRDVVETGGFTRFRRATGTPFNLVFEVRP